MDKKIVAIVVTRNRKEYLLRNIEAILDQKDAQTDILIVDNASTDGTKEAVKPYRETGQIRYENTGENLGGAGGFNYGVRRAVELGYDALWLMDDDTIPDPDALDKLLQAHGDLGGDYGFLTGMVLWKDGSPCRMNEPKYARGSDAQAGAYRKVRQASFVSLFLPRHTVVEFGLPIKEFFIWGDDVEYTRRISAKKDCYLVPDSKVLHDTDSNVGSDIVHDDDRLERYRFAYRNEMYTALEEGGTRRIYQRFKIWYHIGKILFMSKNNKREKIRLIRSASREGRGFHPEIEYVTSEED